VLLHRTLQFETRGVDVGTTGLRVEAVKARHRTVRKILGQGFEADGAGLEIVDDRIAGRLAEYQQVEQRVGPQAVGSVHRSTGDLTGGVEALDRRPVIGDDLALVVGRHATHLVVTGGHDRDRRLDRVDAGELNRNLANARQTLHDHGRIEVGDVEQNEILVRPATATFVDFGNHRPRHHVARSQILGVRRVTLHEAFVGRVTQDASFTAHTLGNQHPGTGDAGWVELPELHVFECDAGARRHAQAITGIDEGIG
jgi:hypothetical protein